MREGGRIAAAIEILSDIVEPDAEAEPGAAPRCRRPAKLALKDWSTAHRFAGAKDRAWISGLVLDALRRARSTSHAMGAFGPRAMALGTLHRSWGWTLTQIAEACAATPHGPGALSPTEHAVLTNTASPVAAPPTVAADIPDWAAGDAARAFGADWPVAMAALAARAPLDLRVNTLKCTPDRAAAALADIHAAPAGVLTTALRIPPAEPGARAAHVEAIPAFAKGWLEVQDLGSQIAAAAAGDVTKAQILDYCAGGGGKALALAAAAGGTGQVYAYDIDARRLAPLYDRAARAGARTLQIRSPAEAGGAKLDDLENAMDVVFVDAPCSGSGTWRRHPDAKWRLRPGQLDRRTEEQDAILAASAAYVRPGGRLVYVVCSLFPTEGEDRVAKFLSNHADFSPLDAWEVLRAAPGLAADAETRLAAAKTPQGALRLSPHATGADGFFVAVLTRAG